MKRMSLVVMVFPLALVAAGAASIACKGGADGFGDAGPDGDILGLLVKGNTIDGGAVPSDACAKAIVTVDDSLASDNGSSGGPGCTKDDECTVRMAGDYCGCPDTPRPMLTSRAAGFDESLNGITQQCTCRIAPCAPAPARKAACRDGRCVLAEP